MTESFPSIEPECAAMFDAWQTKVAEKNGRVLKSDIDPLDLPTYVIPSVFIYQREQHPDRVRFKCRLAGTSLVAAFGSDPTRHYLDEMMDPQFYPVRSHFFEVAATTRCPLYYSGTLALKERDFIAFSRILLPVQMNETDSGTDILIGAMVFLRSDKISESDLHYAKTNNGVIFAAQFKDDTWVKI